MRVGLGMSARRTNLAPVLLAVLSNTMCVLPIFLIGALATLIRASLDIGLSNIGLTFVTFYLSSSVCSVPAGRVVQARGWRWGINAACFLTASALLGFGLFTNSWSHLLMFSVIGGSGYAFAQVSSSLLIAEEVGSLRQGLAFGIKQASVPCAGLLAGLALPIFALQVGWETVFTSFGLFELVFLALLPKRRGLSGHRLHGETEKKRLTNLKALLYLAAAGGLGAATAGVLGAYYVESLVAADVRESLAGSMLALGSVVGLVARVGAGWHADRTDRGTFGPIAWMLIAGGFGFAMLGAEPGLLLIPATLLAFGPGWGWPGLFSFAAVKLDHDAAASATGVVQVGAFVGAGLGPVLFGFAAEEWGFGPAWLATAISAFAAGLMVFIARSAVRHDLALKQVIGPRNLD